MTDRAALLITVMVLEAITDLVLFIGTFYLCAFQGWTLWTVAVALFISAGKSYDYFRRAEKVGL